MNVSWRKIAVAMTKPWSDMVGGGTLRSVTLQSFLVMRASSLPPFYRPMLVLRRVGLGRTVQQGAQTPLFSEYSTQEFVRGITYYIASDPQDYPRGRGHPQLSGCCAGRNTRTLQGVLRRMRLKVGSIMVGRR